MPSGALLRHVLVAAARVAIARNLHSVLTKLLSDQGGGATPSHRRPQWISALATAHLDGALPSWVWEPETLQIWDSPTARMSADERGERIRAALIHSTPTPFSPYVAPHSAHISKN